MDFFGLGRNKGRGFVTVNTREGEASTKEGYLTSLALRRRGGAGATLGGALFADTLLLVGVVGLCAWWWEGRTGWLGSGGLRVRVLRSGAERGAWRPRFRNRQRHRGAAGSLVRLCPGSHRLTGRHVVPLFPMLPVGLVAVGIGSIRLGALGGYGTLPLAICCWAGLTTSPTRAASSGWALLT